MLLHGTKKGFYLELKRVLLWGQPMNPFGTFFSKTVHRGILEVGIALKLIMGKYEIIVDVWLSQSRYVWKEGVGEG
jgi:hypothetical protein